MRDISKRFAKILRPMLYCVLALSAFGIFVAATSKGGADWEYALLWNVIYLAWMLLLVYFVNLVRWRAFAPRRDTDAFYLRSFQNDKASWPVRVAVQDALGDELRLSGIRDLRRRISAWGDGLSPWLKAMRHCTPKFMDLEAEDDWRERLWNSLQTGTLAIVDLSEITPFVLDEIKLVTQAMGLDRVIFLGMSPQQDESQLRKLISKQIGEENAAIVRVLLWPTDMTPAKRKVWLREFKNRIQSLYSEIHRHGQVTTRLCRSYSVRR